MKVLRKYSYIEMIGVIWMPAVTCAMRKDLSGYDIDNMTNDAGEIDRDAVEQWLCSHSGDFQSVTDFSASIELNGETIDIPWANEESEFAYIDCMYGDAA